MFVSVETSNMRKLSECLLGWKYWKIVIGYACMLARIKEVYPFQPQRGLPFAAAKRLALCVGEEVCPLCRGRGLPCFALRTIVRCMHCGKKV